MNPESLQSDWAIWLALAAIAIAVLTLLPRLLRRTSGGRLKQVVADMKKARKELRKNARALRKAEQMASRFAKRAERVKPRLLQEAQEAVEDAMALQKILEDKVMVTENHVRRVIHDEFPPSQHDKLRRRYLPRDIEDDRPFSF